MYRNIECHVKKHRSAAYFLDFGTLKININRNIEIHVKNTVLLHNFENLVP